MKNRQWLYLLVIPCASFGTYFLCSVLFDMGLTGIGGLMTMGLLVIGWPVVAAWLGTVAGKDMRAGWYLPVLFALTMPFVFPYYGAGWIAWGYAGVVLVMGLFTMVGTRLTQ